MINPDRYDQIKPSTLGSQRPSNIPTIVPTPTETDYRRGRIERFFVRKTNQRNGLIFETSKEQTGVLRNSPLYTVVDLDWRITGTEEEIRTSNRKSIQRAAAELPNIKLYLPNLIQFARINS